ncbi:MAG TPA: sulfatase-like hydrolase/transferase [Bryobacteraceae bacterium]|nr:sulfatase-like hydrolase/transferase [Bryobacteraceae bacterium]
MKRDLNRRAFLESLGAYTAGGALLSQLCNRRASGSADAQAATWNAPPVLVNPNILVIMVDQMRAPMWLTASQMTTLAQQFLPNIFGRLRNHAYNFQQYYVAATVCTASRATLLTGLYAPQTAMYLNNGGSGPDLNPAFPTWASALALVNPAYRDNCWWFGKWHLSNCDTSDPLAPYGFHTRTYPGGEACNPSPNGAANEGTDGGTFGKIVDANDAQIAGDFIGWLQGQAPSSAPPVQPWCATVSLINPHDIAYAPAWFTNPCPPSGVPIPSVYFPPPAMPPLGCPQALLSSLPSPWNYENLNKVTGKPKAQLNLLQYMNQQDGRVTDWVQFLNQYYWLLYYVDQQVGAILNALQGSGQAGNTIIIFTSDHGEYGGSHGLHGKGFTAYDESIHVPFYVKFPGQPATYAMSQMCSSVDVFGLICDLATGGNAQWRQVCPDLISRQSLWSFLYQGAAETRLAPALGIPYVLHTCDLSTSSHIVCLRTRTSNPTQPGAKLAIYSEWAPCTVVPDNTAPDYEFYDYNPATSNNTREMGNDYSSSNPAVAAYLAELGAWGPPATGLIASELNAPLVGAGTGGLPLSQAQAAARQSYFDAVSGPGVCTGG